MRVNAWLVALSCLTVGLVTGAITARSIRRPSKVSVTLGDRLKCADAAERYEKSKLQSNDFYTVMYGHAEFSPKRQSCVLDFRVYHNDPQYPGQQYEIDDTITGAMLFNETCYQDHCKRDGGQMLADQQKKLEELSR